jgi:hypothetical protein
MRRYPLQGVEGLQAQSRRPHRNPNAKLTERDRARILKLREADFGARRIQSELRLYDDINYSLATIHKVLKGAQVKPLVKPKRTKPFTRYSRPVPGDRVQMDSMKVAANSYQYTAVDDCSRFRVLGLYPKRDARSTL